MFPCSSGPRRPPSGPEALQLFAVILLAPDDSAGRRVAKLRDASRAPQEAAFAPKDAPSFVPPPRAPLSHFDGGVFDFSSVRPLGDNEGVLGPLIPIRTKFDDVTCGHANSIGLHRYRDRETPKKPASSKNASCTRHPSRSSPQYFPRSPLPNLCLRAGRFRMR